MLSAHRIGASPASCLPITGRNGGNQSGVPVVGARPSSVGPRSSPPRCARPTLTYVCHLRSACLPATGSLLPGRTERRLPGPNMSQQAAPRQTRPARPARRAPSGSPRSMENIALDERELVNGCARYGREVWSGGGRPANSDAGDRWNAGSVAGFGTPAKSKVDREDA